jgi:hypothetical protein
MLTLQSDKAQDKVQMASLDAGLEAINLNLDSVLDQINALKSLPDHAGMLQNLTAIGLHIKICKTSIKRARAISRC